MGGHGVLDHGDYSVQKRVNWICIILWNSNSWINDRKLRIIAMLFSNMELPSLHECWTQGWQVRCVPPHLVFLFHIEPSRQGQACDSDSAIWCSTIWSHFENIIFSFFSSFQIYPSIRMMAGNTQLMILFQVLSQSCDCKGLHLSGFWSGMAFIHILGWNSDCASLDVEGEGMLSLKWDVQEGTITGLWV